MPKVLEEFFRMYGQDFDIVFVNDTDPIDLFCQQHTRDEQNQLLLELQHLCDDVSNGKRTLRDIRRWGLEYLPAREADLGDWLRRLIEYMQRTIAPGSY